MEGIHVVRDLLLQGDWMSRIDLKDAYFTIPIDRDYRRYLRFLWQGQAYEFTCLPFGLATAPRIFTKLLRPVVGFLRSHGVRCVIYLDDLLIMQQDREVLVEHTATVVHLLEALGFLINYPKSHLEPSQILNFLGFVVDSLKRELRLPQEKLAHLKQEARSILKGEYASARKLAQLLGKMSAAVLAVQPAPLHYRELQHLKHTALKAGGYDAKVKVSSRAKQDLAWWVNNLDQWNGKKLQLTTPEISIETDASRSGWGAFSQGESTGGCWDQQESHFHINALEMLAVFYALKAFLKYQQGVSVLILSDNQSVVAHINKLGGTRSQDLIALTKRIWKWCLDRNIQMIAQHIPGNLNITADFLSRYVRDRTDWILNPDIFAALNRTWGPLQVDLFASRFSAQLQRFFSWRADPDAEATDAFSQCWSQILGFAHPPWCLVSRVLHKAQIERATLVVIAPLWKTQAWFPVMMEMLMDHPILLPEEGNVVTPSPNCGCPVQLAVPRLVAWKVSGDSSKRKLFQEKLVSLSSHHGDTRQIQTTIPPGGNGRSGVEAEIFIPFHQVFPKC